MSNRFKDRTMRRIYNAMVATYRDHLPGMLFQANGERLTGNGYASPFWKGYDGVTLPAGYWDSYSKTTPSYACWCAGRDIRKQESN